MERRDIEIHDKWLCPISLGLGQPGLEQGHCQSSRFLETDDNPQLLCVAPALPPPRCMDPAPSTRSVAASFPGARSAPPASASQMAVSLPQEGLQDIM